MPHSRAGEREAAVPAGSKPGSSRIEIESDVMPMGWSACLPAINVTWASSTGERFSSV